MCNIGFRFAFSVFWVWIHLPVPHLHSLQFFCLRVYRLGCFTVVIVPHPLAVLWSELDFSFSSQVFRLGVSVTCMYWRREKLERKLCQRSSSDGRALINCRKKHFSCCESDQATFFFQIFNLEINYKRLQSKRALFSPSKRGNFLAIQTALLLHINYTA